MEILELLKRVEENYLEACRFKTELQVKLETLHTLGAPDSLIAVCNDGLEEAVKLEKKSKKAYIEVLEIIENA